VPAPTEELEQRAFDVCRGCRQPIVQHWSGSGAWVTMTGGSPVCYGRNREGDRS